LLFLAFLWEVLELLALAEIEDLLLGVFQKKIQTTQDDKRQGYLFVFRRIKCLYQNVIGDVPEE
jgi:hypothetical protein